MSNPHPQYCFELFIPDNKDQVIKACKTEADGRVVEGNHTFYRISAQTAEEKDQWMNSIRCVCSRAAQPVTDEPRSCSPSHAPPPLRFDPHRAAISRDPFYEMLAARKKKVSSMKRH